VRLLLSSSEAAYARFTASLRLISPFLSFSMSSALSEIFHKWYTVFSSIFILAATALAGSPLDFRKAA